MKRSLVLAVIAFAAGAVFGASTTAFAQAAAPAAAAKLPADPWPRDVGLTSAAVLVYQPQVNKWEGNQIDFRAALAIKPTGAKEETFGVIFATARTQVDKVARTVVFENLKITKIDFPTLPDRGAAYARRAAEARSPPISHDLARPAASVARARRRSSRRRSPVQNNPPQVIVSYSPAILVPIDGAPVMKPVPSSSRFQRVINTRALILQGGFGNNFYIHVYDGWLSASSLAGPWTQVFMGPLVLSDADAIAQQLSRRPARSTCSTAGRRPIPSRRSPTASPTIYTTPGADRAHRVQGPARFRADRRHAAAVGVEHDQRRADRHGEQQLLRAARRPLVQGAGADRARGRSSPAMRCRRTSRRSRRTRSPAPCCRPSRARRRRRRR